MVDLSPEMVTLVMFGAAIIGILIGYPLVFVLGSIALLVGVIEIQGLSGGKEIVCRRAEQLDRHQVSRRLPDAEVDGSRRWR